MTIAPIPAPRLGLGLADLAGDYDLILCDVWGVIHNGVRNHRPAVDALRRFRAGGGTVVLVTNAPVPATHVERRLDKLQVPREAYDAIATSGDVTIDIMVAAGCPPVFGIGPACEIALYQEAARLGPRAPERVPPERADLAVCIGLDEMRPRPEDYDDILRRLRVCDLDLVCANPDLVVEMGDELVFCAGAIAERYASLSGTVVHAGKPFAAIYRRAFALASRFCGDVAKDRVLAIGDAMRTDMQGAHEQGIAGLFVTAGIHRAALHGDTRDPSIDAAVLETFLAACDARPLAAMPCLAWR